VELGPYVILGLKVAVTTVTALLLISLVALLRGNYRLHGRLNVTFFLLTLVTLFGFELLVQVIRPELFDYIKQNESLRQALNIHLCFAVPSAVVMPAMLFSGLAHRRWLHVSIGMLFAVLWAGTFVTGIFFLPHTA
jgi:uncharacterized membrane protein YozB (DUF420 family)